MNQQVDTLAKLCGYGRGWCKVTPASWFECKKALLDNRLGGVGCRYFSKHHPSFSTIVMNEKRELVRDNRQPLYDERFSTIQMYDEAEPGLIRVDDIGYCDFCKLATYFYDTNIGVYICSRSCRVAEYKKLERDNE